MSERWTLGSIAMRNGWFSNFNSLRHLRVLGVSAVNSATVCLFSLLLLVQLTFAQTRPRRAEQAIPEPSPAAQTRGPEPQEQIDVIRVNTTLVTVPVSVRDRNGRYIPDLQKEDFQVFEEGIEQEIEYFATVEKAVIVVLMLDTSVSTWSKLNQIKDAAKAFVEQLRADDQVMVVSFARGLTIKCEPTAERQKIRKAIDGTGRGLSTHLYDAMNKLMEKHLNRIEGRKALVLFTDGVDATSNDSTYESTLHDAQELDALIYPIRYDTYNPAADKGDPPISQPRMRLPGILRKIPLPTIGSSGSGGGAGSSRADYDRGERYLLDLAESTGGRVYEAGKNLNYLRDAFSQIAEELSRQYTLGYYPRKKEGSGERRKIKVRVNKSEVAVRARDSYIYKSSSAAGTSPTTSEASETKSSPPVLKPKPLVND
jgi:Ca-activated chloride channel family protein